LRRSTLASIIAIIANFGKRSSPGKRRLPVSRQSSSQADRRSTTIKARDPKISLSLLSGRHKHLLAAPAKMSILIVARLPSGLMMRYTNKKRLPNIG
jgi:hypothetical protein